MWEDHTYSHLTKFGNYDLSIYAIWAQSKLHSL